MLICFDKFIPLFKVNKKKNIWVCDGKKYVIFKTNLRPDYGKVTGYEYLTLDSSR